MPKVKQWLTLDDLAGPPAMTKTLVKCPVCGSASRTVWMLQTSFDYCDTCKEDVTKVRKPEPPATEAAQVPKFRKHDVVKYVGAPGPGLTPGTLYAIYDIYWDSYVLPIAYYLVGVARAVRGHDLEKV